MCFRVIGYVSVCGLVWMLFSSDELRAQNVYHWNRTTQSSSASSSTGAGVYLETIPPVTDSDNATSSTPPENDLAASNCGSSASADDGQGSSGEGSAMVEGSCELNPDGQPTLSWSFIHSGQFQVRHSAPQGFADVHFNQQTSVDTRAVLEEDIPTAGTIGSLFLDIGWVSSSGYWPNEAKSINMWVSFGDAYLQITGSGWWSENIIASGMDGYGNWFSKASDAPLNSATGSIGIGNGEFTSPLQAGDEARIDCVNPVVSSQYLEIGGWQDAFSGIFQGVIAINAGY